MSQLREKILGATARRYVDVPVLIGGATVVITLQSWTEKERSAFELVRDGCRKDADWNARMEDQRRRLIVELAVDKETKQRLFTPLDVVALEHVDANVTGELFNAATLHVGYRKSDIEDNLKNSDRTPAPEQATS